MVKKMLLLLLFLIPVPLLIGSSSSERLPIKGEHEGKIVKIQKWRDNTSEFKGYGWEYNWYKVSLKTGVEQKIYIDHEDYYKFRLGDVILIKEAVNCECGKNHHWVVLDYEKLFESPILEEEEMNIFKDVFLVICILSGAITLFFSVLYMWARWGDMGEGNAARFITDMKIIYPISLGLFFITIFLTAWSYQ